MNLRSHTNPDWYAYLKSFLHFDCEAHRVRRRATLLLQRMTPFVLLFTVLGSNAFACRYTIRDIGFVDMQGPTYKIWLVGGDADRAGQAKQWLGPSNIQVAAIPDGASEHPAVRLAGTESIARTTTESRRVDKAGLPIHLVLEGPGDRFLYLGRASGESEFKSLINSAVTSPARDKIQRLALETFAFVVSVETDPQLTVEASSRLKQFESQLPRSIDHPVITLDLTKSQQEERVLLWSLGIDASHRPAVTVLYGRGKRMDAPVYGDHLDAKSVALKLAFVGESCECETDRDWVNEPVIPMRWGPDQWEQTRTLLGFDPESPLVKAEVVRIIGKGIRPDEADPRKPRDDMASILLGYREVDVPDSSPAAQVSVRSNDVSTASIDALPVSGDTDGMSTNASEVVPPKIAAESKTDLAPNSLRYSVSRGVFGAIGFVALCSLIGVAFLVAKSSR